MAAPLENVRVITKLVHTLLEKPGRNGTSFADLKAEVKDACAKHHIAYDAEVVGAALESALAQQKAKR